MPYNKKTGVMYQGKNIAILLSSKARQGFTSDEWITFLQAKELGYKVKKGSKSTSIFKVVRDDKATKKKDKSCVRFYNLFNINQCEKV
jgi:antirestriction protein ArdC